MLIKEGVIGPDEEVVCVLTGHELKDPNATVQYHTGLDMKAVQDIAPRTEPHGACVNRPIKVPDTVEAILLAMGVSPKVAATASAKLQ